MPATTMRRLLLFLAILLLVGTVQGVADSRSSMLDDRVLGTLPPPPILDFRLKPGDWLIDEWTGYEGYRDSGTNWRQPGDPFRGPTFGFNAVVTVYDRTYLRLYGGGATPFPLRTIAGFQTGYQILVGHLSDSSLTLALGSFVMLADNKPAVFAHLSGHWAKQLDRDLFSNGIVFRHGILAALDVPVPVWDAGTGFAPRVAPIRIGAGWQFQFDSVRLSLFLDGSSNGNLRGLIGIGYRPREFGTPVTTNDDF